MRSVSLTVYSLCIKDLTVSELSTSAIPQPERLVALDALRGIAALLVTIAHLTAFYITEHFTIYTAGRFGVVLFFLVSGYVIPPTFARHRSQSVFWIHRLCRLLPLYWMTICIAAILMATIGLQESVFFPARSGVAYMVNLTMIPKFLGYQSVLSVFWSLHVEVLFYILVAATGMVGLQHKSLLVGIALLILVMMSIFVPSIFSFYLAFLPLIWCGTVIHAMTTKGQPLIYATPFFVAAIALSTIAEGQPTLIPLYIGTEVVAFMLFIIALRRPQWFAWRGLVWLGSISYSLYLLHLLVLAVVPPIGPPTVGISIWLGCCLIVSALAERWIERPSIALGRWLTQPRRTRTLAQPVPSPIEDSNVLAQHA